MCVGYNRRRVPVSGWNDKKEFIGENWSRGRASNPRPADYEVSR
jgi:hypothetical protein